ncbi:hypothetical protein HDU78_003690 [Chytriomyces hyalinus]|nr:hypothetical protein HDU78_003690 [Chytriomyces hyalinus]KAJ3258031.1 hypothetical protein HDU77_002457 [Chytriomyces hyalinus]
MAEEVVIIQTRPGAYVYDPAKAAENGEHPDGTKPASFEPLQVVGGTLLSIILTPIIAPWLMICCRGPSKDTLRASYNLGLAIGFVIWGIIFIIVASLVTTTFQTMCVEMIYEAAMAQVSASDKKYMNATMIADIKINTVAPFCTLYLSYVLYAFIAFGLLFLGMAACMCHRSNKILKRRRVSAM